MTEPLKTISIKQDSCSDDEQFLRGDDCKIELHKEHLRYISSGDWKVMNETLGMYEEKRFSNDICIARFALPEIQIYLHSSSGKYVVTFAEGILIPFASKSEAMHVYNMLINWRFDEK